MRTTLVLLILLTFCLKIRAVVAIGNVGEDPNGNVSVVENRWIGVQFTTGSQPFTVTKALFGGQTDIDPTGKELDLVVSVWTDISDSPGAVLAGSTFNNPTLTSTDFGIHTFSAESPFELEAASGYWVVMTSQFTGGSEKTPFLWSTTLGSEPSGSLASVDGSPVDYQQESVDSGANWMGNLVGAPFLWQLETAAVPEPRHYLLLSSLFLTMIFTIRRMVIKEPRR